MTFPLIMRGDWLISETTIDGVDLAAGTLERWRAVHRERAEIHYVRRVRASYPETGSRLVCSCGYPACSAVAAIYPVEARKPGDAA